MFWIATEVVALLLICYGVWTSMQVEKELQAKRKLANEQWKAGMQSIVDSLQRIKDAKPPMTQGQMMVWTALYAAAYNKPGESLFNAKYCARLADLGLCELMACRDSYSENGTHGIAIAVSILGVD